MASPRHDYEGVGRPGADFRRGRRRKRASCGRAGSSTMTDLPEALGEFIESPTYARRWRLAPPGGNSTMR